MDDERMDGVGAEEEEEIAPGAWNSRLSRKKLLKAAAMGGSALALSTAFEAFGRDVVGSAKAASELKYMAGQLPPHPKWHFTFVNHVTTNPFFVPTIYGIQDACTLLGCSYSWTGSEKSLVGEMVSAMNTAIASRTDGIAVALIDPHAFNAPTNKALARGIPVVSYNADEPNRRLAYIGQGLYQSGVKVGKRIVQLVGHGDVVIFIATPGTANIQPRSDGARAAIKASGKPINVAQIATGALVPDELAAVNAYYIGHRSVRGMFAVDGGSTAAVGQVIARHGLKGKVKGGGYDLLPLTLQYINSGHLDFTIDQQPYVQGFYPIVQLFLYKLTGSLISPSDTDTGLKFVTKANVGKYIHTKSRYEGSSSAEKWIH